MLDKTELKTLAEDVMRRRLLLVCAVFTAVLCFGFTATNFSIGVDDPAREYYFYTQNTGSLIQQGRLLHVGLNLLTHCVQFIPFFTDFLGAALYALSALLYCGVLSYVTGGKLSTGCLSAFACVYISSSVIAEKYIYHLDVLALTLGYCCAAGALFYAFRLVKGRRPGDFGKAALALALSVGSYESFLFVYFCGVFAVLLLELAVNGEKKAMGSLLKEGVAYAGILLVSVAGYYLLVLLVQLATGQYGIFTRSTVWTRSDAPFWETFRGVCASMRTILTEFIQQRYLPVLVFFLCSAGGGILFALESLKRRSVWPLVCFAALLLGNFGVHLATGAFYTRAAQTFCLFSGFVVMMLARFLSGRSAGRKLAAFCVALLVLIQSADMNRWFYNDYVRYRKEVFVIDTLATRLVAECDLSKPVVFTNWPEFDYLDTELYSGRQVNGNSVLYWSIVAFGDKTQPFVAELFRMHGYDFILSPTEEQYDAARKAAQDMPPWPQEGCIRELEECIVVNFG